MSASKSWTVVGGSGFVGRAMSSRLLADGARVTIVDVRRPPETLIDRVRWLPVNVVRERVIFGSGRLVVLAGQGPFDPVRASSMVATEVLPVARLGDDLSHATVLTDLPQALSANEKSRVRAWCANARRVAAQPLGAAEEALLAGSLLDGSEHDVAAARRLATAARIHLARTAGARVLACAEIFGVGQEGRVATRLRELYGQMTRSAVHSGALPVVALDSVIDKIVGTVDAVACDGYLDLEQLVALSSEAPLPTAVTEQLSPPLDRSLRAFAGQVASTGSPVFDPPLAVVIPPRPERPHRVASQLVDVLQSGAVKYGNRFTKQLESDLAERLALDPTQHVLVTNSGTAALRLAVSQLRTKAPRVAVVPAFTFAATGEFLAQLGYSLIFCDVDSDTWTLDPISVRQALAAADVDLVVSVDALGNPADYRALVETCENAGVALVADSAPSLGARYRQDAVGNQTALHAFSLSFAKVVSAGGSGGFLVHPANLDLGVAENWLRSSLMTEASAVIALDQLTQLDRLLERRRRVAEVYHDGLSDVPGIKPQRVEHDSVHSYVHYVVDLGTKARSTLLASGLHRLGVQTKPYYSPLLDELLPGLAAPGGFRVSQALHGRLLALPMSSEMTSEDASRVVSAIHRSFFESELRQQR